MSSNPREKKQQRPTDCTQCQSYEYDEEYGDYVCLQDMDEDDWVRMMGKENFACPYFRAYDEYLMVRKQN